jgi:hypothetical protein
MSRTVSQRWRAALLDDRLRLTTRGQTVVPGAAKTSNDEAAAAGAEPVADVAPHGNAGGLEVLRLDSAEHDGVANAQSESVAAALRRDFSCLLAAAGLSKPLSSGRLRWRATGSSVARFSCGYTARPYHSAALAAVAAQASM